MNNNKFLKPDDKNPKYLAFMVVISGQGHPLE